MRMTTPMTDNVAVQPEMTAKKPASKRTLAKRYRNMMAQAGRLRVLANGSRRFMRFSQVEVFEHWVLLVTLSMLALTGIMQQLVGTEPVALVLQIIFGGVVTLKLIHLQFAILFGALALFHAGRTLYVWFVKRQAGGLMPRRKDAADLRNLLLYRLDRTSQPPAFGRYTVEEKLIYWKTVLFAGFSILTGLLPWAWVLVPQFLPVEVILVSRTLHRLVGLLAAVTLIPWFLYYTLFKARNTGIFSGYLGEEAMQKNHPLDYQRIMDACQEIERLKQQADQPAPAEPPGTPSAEAAPAIEQEVVMVPVETPADA